MAAPTNTTTISDYVMVTIITGSDISSNTPNTYTGIVEQIGSDVTNVIVGDQIFFMNAYFFSIGTTSWALTQEKNIFLTYTALP